MSPSPLNPMLTLCVNSQAEYPNYLQSIVFQLDRLSTSAASQIDARSLFLHLLSPKPLTLFLEKYLTDINLDTFLKDAKEIAFPRPKNFIKDVSGVRPNTLFPMREDDFLKSLPYLENPTLIACALIIQRGLETYFEEVIKLLKTRYLVDDSNLIQRLRTPQKFQSVLQEMLPFFALSQAENKDKPDSKFTGVFKRADENQAFTTARHHAGITQCPATQLMKHVLNTAYHRSREGKIRILNRASEDGLVAYLYKELSMHTAVSSEISIKCVLDPVS